MRVQSSTMHVWITLDLSTLHLATCGPFSRIRNRPRPKAPTQVKKWQDPTFRPTPSLLFSTSTGTFLSIPDSRVTVPEKHHTHPWNITYMLHTRQHYKEWLLDLCKTCFYIKKREDFCMTSIHVPRSRPENHTLTVSISERHHTRELTTSMHSSLGQSLSRLAPGLWQSPRDRQVTFRDTRCHCLIGHDFTSSCAAEIQEMRSVDPDHRVGTLADVKTKHQIE